MLFFSRYCFYLNEFGLLQNDVNTIQFDHTLTGGDYMLDGKKLGALIQSKRKEQHLKQTEMAEALGLSRTYLSDIENGRYLPSTKTLSKIAIFINLDLNVLKMTEIQVIEEGGYDRATGACRSKAL